MKSVLYVAAALMIGASIYGFIDYSKTSHRKEFKTMYDEPVIKEPVVVEEKVKKDVVSTDMISKKEIAETKKEEVKKPAKKIKKKRTLNFKSFSRAPLKEKREVILAEMPAEVKEVNDKEQ